MRLHAALTFWLAILLPANNGVSEELLQEHSSRPLQAEATLEALQTWETPVEGFFIRSHFDAPVVDPQMWRLEISGLVDHPLSLSLAELKALPQQSLYAVLECSGNGRGLQKPPAGGVQWQKGAVGNGQWTGVSLASLLAKAGVQKSARFATLSGADSPALPSVPRFIRSIPIDKLSAKDTLLALGLNRQPLPPLHGGPVRLVLPNWYGENWTKWITKIVISDNEDQSFYMKTGYRMPKQPVKPGEAWDPATGSPIEQIRVQSIIASPRADEMVAKGDVTIRGKTFSGAGAITKVEISTDQGRTWQIAEVEMPHKDGGWQEFSKTIKAEAASITVWSRATDKAGQIQPLETEWNPGGYLRNGVDSVTFSVGTTAHSAPRELLETRCLICHSQKLIESQRLSNGQWKKVLDKMIKYGAILTSEEATALQNYLANVSPEMTPATPARLNYLVANTNIAAKVAGNIKRGATLFQKNCAVCHDGNGQGKIGPRIQQLSLSQEEFSRTVLNGKRTMPAFANVLQKTDLLDIRAFLSKVAH